MNVVCNFQLLEPSSVVPNMQFEHTSQVISEVIPQIPVDTKPMGRKELPQVLIASYSLHKIYFIKLTSPIFFLILFFCRIFLHQFIHQLLHHSHVGKELLIYAWVMPCNIMLEMYMLWFYIWILQTFSVFVPFF